MILKAKIRSDIADGIYKTPILDYCYNGATLFLLKPGDVLLKAIAILGHEELIPMYWDA